MRGDKMYYKFGQNKFHLWKHSQKIILLVELHFEKKTVLWVGINHDISFLDWLAFANFLSELFHLIFVLLLLQLLQYI